MAVWVACGILVPGPGSQPLPLANGSGVTTELLENSLKIFLVPHFKLSNIFLTSSPHIIFSVWGETISLSSLLSCIFYYARQNCKALTPISPGPFLVTGLGTKDGGCWREGGGLHGGRKKPLGPRTRRQTLGAVSGKLRRRPWRSGDRKLTLFLSCCSHCPPVGRASSTAPSVP